MASSLGFSAAEHVLGQSYSDCTGCAACAAVCPAGAIHMQNDLEGFKQPRIESTFCNQCGACRDTCPMASVHGLARKVDLVAGRLALPEVHAAWNLDEAVRRMSSSGGAFSALADTVLAQQGVVVGAAFDADLVVRHVAVTDATGLGRLRGSKYVQSTVTAGIYHLVERLLSEGRPVLFSGTPCQVMGLRSYLHEPREGLRCCDVVCLGVPSPRLLARYVEVGLRGATRLKELAFRDKGAGWKHPRVRRTYADGSVHFTTRSADPFMRAYQSGYALRRCCYQCTYAATRRQGDVTLGDFWGVGERYPAYDPDDKGTSLVIANSVEGRAWLGECRSSLFVGDADIAAAIAGNLRLACSQGFEPAERTTFYDDLARLGLAGVVRRYRLRPPRGVIVRLLTAAFRKAIDVLRRATRLRPRG